MDDNNEYVMVSARRSKKAEEKARNTSKALMKQEEERTVLFVLCFWALFLFGSYTCLQKKSEAKLHSLELKGDYRLPVITKNYGIEYYVKSLDKFDKKYPVGTSARAEIEKDVIKQNVKRLQVDCYYELWKYKIMLRGDFPEFPTRACDKLESIDKHFDVPTF